MCQSTNLPNSAYSLKTSDERTLNFEFHAQARAWAWARRALII